MSSVPVPLATTLAASPPLVAEAYWVIAELLEALAEA